MAEAVRNTNAATAPLRPVRLGPSDVLVERKPDGTLYLRSPHPLEAYPDKLTQRLEHWAKAAPDRVFLAQRAADGAWRTLSYAQALAQVRSIAQALLERNLSPERPIAILSGNDIEHALLALAAMMIGIPYAPISVPYSLMSTRLRQAQVDHRDADARAGVRRRRQAVRPRDRRRGADRRRDRVTAANPLGSRPTTLVRRPADDRADRRGRCRPRQGRPRHDREIPVHLGLDRHTRRA